MQRGIHDIHRSFGFRSNPGFIFHYSPDFETGDKKGLQKVLSFLEEKAKSKEVDDQLHAIWSVSLSQRTNWPLMISSAMKGFVLTWAVIYRHWKQSSLRQRWQEKVSFALSFKSYNNILQYPLSRSSPNSIFY